jgi:hypothetical protein
MSATATPDAYGPGPRRERRWRDDESARRSRDDDARLRGDDADRSWHEDDRDPRRAGRWSPWTAPKPILIGAMILGFILFWPIGLAILFFMIGSGRIGKRWARRYGMDPARSPEAGRAWSSWNWGCERGGTTTGNAAFDEYRVETLRRLEEEQKDFSAFLERLRFAKDRAEFEQFMLDRRSRPPAPPQEPQPQPQG